MSAIVDGRILFGCALEAWWHHPRLASPTGPLARLGPHPPLDQVADADPLRARIYAGQWIVDCPCGGADFIWLEQPLMRCSSCGNASVGGLWRRVTVPRKGSRLAIETALMARPDPSTRHWLPGEKVSDLIVETVEHQSRR